MLKQSVIKILQTFQEVVIIFTFSHFTEAFIQSDLQLGIKHLVYHPGLSQCA